MEIIYLLCSIVSTVITSFALSLFLLIRSLLRCCCSCSWKPAAYSAAVTVRGEEPIALYQGTVWHERRRPVRHSFRYSVRYALVDLDRAPEAAPGYLSADEARQFAGTNGQVLLLTIPPSVGYEQNPLSLYYCYAYDLSSSSFSKHLKNCIAEVTNTPWGEKVRFVFNPSSDLVAKPLHVSPFMDMVGNWSMKASAPGETLSVAISVQHPNLGNYFSATLKAKQVPDDNTWFFWLMPHKVALWIYWHALKLWWENVAFIQHPRYSNPAYREEAITRDQDLRCCRGGGTDVAVSNNKYNGGDRRCFVWRDAKWPWS